MKKIVFALLFLSLPAFAQTVTEGGVPYDGVQGALVANNDAVRLRLSGTRWATVQFQVVSAGTATATAQITNDGTNFVSAPFAKRITTVSANPTVQAISATTLVTGDIWEVVLPSNAVAFQLLAGVGTSTTVKIVGGLPFMAGAPVTGTLYDTTSGVNTAIDTGTLDLSGWEFAVAAYTTPAGGSGTISMVDDAGTSVTMFTPPASATAWYPFAVASPSVSQVTALPATGSTGALPLQKRMRFQSAAVAALTSRIRIEVRR
jgi:predicted RecA/RadA family phage recombinase